RTFRPPRRLGPELLPDKRPHQRGDHGAEHERKRDEEAVEGLRADRPQRDPDDESDGQGHEDLHADPLRFSIAPFTFVSVLKAATIAFSAPDSCSGSMPICRANAAPS